MLLREICSADFSFFYRGTFLEKKAGDDWILRIYAKLFGGILTCGERYNIMRVKKCVNTQNYLTRCCR